LYLPWMNVSKCYFEELLTVHLFVHKANLPMGNHKEPKIFLSPTSQYWFKELVMDVMLKYGLNKKIVVSDMTAKPFH
jgi:hypothetical protein